jgi:SET family sugar efflux transporter-like MFS transporter
VRRLLIPSAALLWGLQFAFLNPALALLLVTLFDATPGQVGTVLAVYNASGFVASLALPAYADRTRDYLRVMLVCGLLTLALAGLLAVTMSLPVAVVGLVALGGPAGVGSSLLFAQLKYSGASSSDVINTRAIVSFAWVAGPPLATLIMSAFGNQAILGAIALVAVANIATTSAMLAQRSRGGPEPVEVADATENDRSMPRTAVVVIVAVFVLLQATNSAAVSVMSVYVTQTLGLNVAWAGIALGVAATLEIPALLLIGRLNRRVSSLALIVVGCLAGIAYYVAMALVVGPAMLVSVQVLNAIFFAVVAGVGLALFQQIIPRPGLASGLYTNTRRLGAIVSGPIIALGSLALGYRAVFVACAALTGLALLVATALTLRIGRSHGARHPEAPGERITRTPDTSLP